MERSRRRVTLMMQRMGVPRWLRMMMMMSRTQIDADFV